MDDAVIDKISHKLNCSPDVIQPKLETYIQSNDTRRKQILNELQHINIYQIVNNWTDNGNNPVLFCVVRNERFRIPQFIRYYRDLGIDRFVFVDNGSTDGTRDWLSKENGVILYGSDDTYSSERRVAWLNYALVQHGINRWCVVVDADEYLTYIGCENHPITELLQMTETKRYQGFMIDMFPKGSMFCCDENWFSECVYFEPGSICKKQWKHGTLIEGGVRGRVFQFVVGLSKYPLFYYEGNDFYANAHYLTPKMECPIWFAIRHYKFVDKLDFDKVEEAVRNEQYYRHSHMYKKYYDYIKENGDLIFYSDRAVRYENSESLKCIGFLETPKFT